MTALPVTCEIDFAAEGRRHGFIRVPHSVTRSAYGFVPVPVISLRRGAGPKVVLMAGNHGDEFEGQVVLTRLAAALELDDVAGQLVILPAANTPAAVAGLRTSPLDGGNLNRSFTDEAGATPTSMIAHYLEHVVFDGIDYLLDLHSGGTSLEYLPTVLAKWGADTVDNDRRRRLLDVLGLPFALLFEADDDTPFATAAAARRGGIGLTTELGGGGRVTPAYVTLIEAGLRRYLREVGVCPNLDTEPAIHEPRLLYAGGDHQLVFARASGLFEPVVELGEEVEAGRLGAWIHTPEQPWRESQAVYFETAGVVICQRTLGRAEPGDCLFEIGMPAG